MNGKQHGGQNREKLQKDKEKYVFLCFYVFLRFFLVFRWFFIGFSLDLCKGRISKNTLQISLIPAKILPLSIFSVLTPASYPRATPFPPDKGFHTVKASSPTWRREIIIYRVHAKKKMFIQFSSKSHGLVTSCDERTKNVND